MSIRITFNEPTDWKQFAQAMGDIVLFSVTGCVFGMIAIYVYWWISPLLIDQALMLWLDPCPTKSVLLQGAQQGMVIGMITCMVSLVFHLPSLVRPVKRIFLWIGFIALVSILGAVIGAVEYSVAYNDIPVEKQYVRELISMYCVYRSAYGLYFGSIAWPFVLWRWERRHS